MSKEKNKLLEQYPKYEKQIEASMSNKTLEKILVNIIIGVVYFYSIQTNYFELSLLYNIKMITEAFIVLELIFSLFLVFGYFAIIMLTNYLFGKYEKKYKSKWNY